MKRSEKKICESSDDVIRGHRLSDGWENEEFDNARKISNFNETLDGTFDGLINYHEAVAGSMRTRSVIRDERSNNPCER